MFKSARKLSIAVGFNVRDFIKAFWIRMDDCHTFNLRYSNGLTLNFVRREFFRGTKGTDLDFFYPRVCSLSVLH
jgi:hypothetical protein